jgi:hypothetical protein
MKARASLLFMIINEEAQASYFIIIKMIAGSLVETQLGKLVKTGWPS